MVGMLGASSIGGKFEEKLILVCKSMLALVTSPGKEPQITAQFTGSRKWRALRNSVMDGFGCNRLQVLAQCLRELEILLHLLCGVPKTLASVNGVRGRARPRWLNMSFSSCASFSLESFSASLRLIITRRCHETVWKLDNLYWRGR
jgi:hypothetical protein